jgi:hypothetical protein
MTEEKRKAEALQLSVDLDNLLQKHINEIQALLGKESAVVIMATIPFEDSHSIYTAAWRGRCMLVDGLCLRGPKAITDKLYEIKT